MDNGVRQVRLCDSRDCTSCGACANVCPKDAVRLVPDERGFPVPRIDADLCVECHRCERICPILNPKASANLSQPKTYAVWHDDDVIRRASSSGGAFTLIAEQVLKRGGLVVGAAWNQELIPELVIVEKISDLAKLRESKYVQSNVGLVFRQVRSLLRQGREVLLCAAPCQVAGFYAFLGEEKYDNLTTVDFICHAMPSPVAFKKYLSHLENKLGGKIVNFHFRNKSIGVECNLLAVADLVDGRREMLFLNDNAFSYAFIHNMLSKQACGTCRFNRLPRQADFSLADYRGLGEHVRFAYEIDKVKGFTGVLVNSPHAEAFVKDLDQRTCVERPFDELSGSQAHLRTPARVNPQSAGFWKDFSRMEWEELVEKYIAMPWKYRLCIFLRRALGPMLFLKLGVVWKSLRGIRTTGPWLGKDAAK